MMLISGSIPNFVNGVSQQPFTLRLASQSESQENGLSTAAQGLKKRPPTVFLNRQPVSGSDIYLHTINRDVSERYVLCIENGDLAVYGLDGSKKTVTFPHGKAYLTTAGGTPVANQFAAVSVADYTFIVNKNVRVKEGTKKTPVRPDEGLVNVRQGIFGKTYSVQIDDKTASYTTPNGTGQGDAMYISTDYIANQLLTNLIIEGVTAANGYQMTMVGSTIHVSSTKAFTMSSQDGFNNNALILGPPRSVSGGRIHHRDQRRQYGQVGRLPRSVRANLRNKQRCVERAPRARDLRWPGCFDNAAPAGP